MAPPFTTLFNKKNNRSESQSLNSNASSSSIVGWLAFEEAVNALNDVAPGPLIPLHMALRSVLSCMGHAEKAASSHEEFQQLATKIDGFTDIFLYYKDTDYLSPTMHGHIDEATEVMEDIGAGLSAQTGRLGKRTLPSFKDVKEVIDKLDHVLQRFKMYGDLDAQLTITTRFDALATDNTLNKLRYVPTAGIDALDEDGCMDGTRVEILQNLQKWCTDPAEPPLFWLDGMAGTGKSTISRSLSRFLREHGLLGGSFFCRGGHDSRSDVKRILPTLAWFLARRDFYYRSSLLQSLNSDPDLAHYSIERQAKLLLEEPLRQMSTRNQESKRPPPVLVIDALDECADGEGVRDLLDKLLSLPSGLPIKFFLTSRPERHIRVQFESPHAKLHRVLRLHDVEQYTVDEDISRYLRVQLTRIRTSSDKDFPHEWPTRRDIERLTTLTGKLFVYAFTAIKYIEVYDPIGRLEKLMGITKGGNLDEIYSLVLSAAMNPKFEKSDILKTKRLLGAILASREPLCVSDLARLLDIRLSEARTNLNRLHAVISVPPSNEDSVVHAFHSSLGDYLTTSGRAPAGMLISVGVGHRDLANGCLQAMNEELKFNIADCKTSHLPNSEQPHASISSLLKYSCLHWANHVVAAAEVESILERVERVLFSKFLYWLEVLSVINANKMASVSLLRILTAESMKHKMTSNLVGFFEDANEFVTVFQNAISFSAPHIYISAMPFVREDSMISRMFSSMFQRAAKFTSRGIEQRRKIILDIRGHSAQVTTVSFSPDGTRIVSGSDDNTIRVWDARTGQELINPLHGHTGWVTSVRFSPDGTRIVSGSDDRTIRVWDARTGELMYSLHGHTGRATSVDFSPDGTRIVSGSDDKTIRVWDASTGGELMYPLQGHTSAVWSVSFSPDCTRIVSGSSDRTIRVWDARTGEELTKPLQGHTSAVWSVSFSPDCTRIVSGSDDNTIRVWDARTGEELMRPLNGHTGSVTSVVFSPDGTRIVSGSDDNTIRVWDTETGEELINPLNGHTGSVTSVVFSPDGTRIVSGSVDKTIRVWDARTGMDPLHGHTSEVSSAKFSPDGTRIVSGSDDKTIRVWNARTGKELMDPLHGHTSEVWSVNFSPDGTRIVSGSSDNTIRVWDARTGKELMDPLHGHTSEVWSVDFSSDGTRIVSGSSDKTIRVWDTRTGKLMSILTGHTGKVTSVSFSLDGTRIVSGSIDKTIRVWDAKTGGKSMGLFNGHTSVVSSVKFSPDGTCIVSGSSDKTIRVWDARTGKELMNPLRGHTSEVWSVDFSPDGTRIVSGSSDKTIRVWDAKTGDGLMNPLNGHTYLVSSVNFSPDGARIVSGSSDNTIRVWGARRFEELMNPLDAHTSEVQSVKFSPDGTCIVSGLSDNTIRVWNVKTGEKLMNPLNGHTGRVATVSFSLDGTRIVSGSFDKTIRVWDAKTGEESMNPLSGHTERVNSVSFSPDGTLIVSGSSDKTIRVWDARTGEELINPLVGHTSEVWSVDFSPDGSRIVSGSSDKTIRVWDAKTGEELMNPLNGHTERINSVSFSPDGTCIFSGSSDKTIRVWDARTGEELTNPLVGHTSEVWSVDFSPDGSRIVSCSSDKTIRVWDARTGEVLMNPLHGHTSEVRSVNFSLDGTLIVSGSYDKTIRVWDVGSILKSVQHHTTPLSSNILDARHVSMFTSNGWICDLDNRLILNILPEYVSCLVLPPCQIVIGSHCVFIDSRQFFHGTEWTLVYTPGQY